MRRNEYKSIAQQLKEMGIVCRPHAEVCVEYYMVDFKKVSTKELVKLYRHLTFFNGWIGWLEIPRIDKERVAYLNKVNKFLGTNFTIEEELDPMDVRILKFTNNEEAYKIKIKEILDTRENVPNKKQGKVVRKLKSQGKFFID